MAIIHSQQKYRHSVFIEVLKQAESQNNPRDIRSQSIATWNADPRNINETTFWDSLYLSVGKNPLGEEKILEHYTIELNSVDSTTLEHLPGIGAYTAKSIIRYRDRLGGFVSRVQLREIPYIDSQLYCSKRIIWIVDLNKIKKLSLVELNIRRLYAHPYIGKHKAKNLLEFRKVHGPITQKLFMNMLSFTEIDRVKLKPYLRFAHSPNK
ncbi:MAG: helix-hairpin-helix domain-containing protein [Bacteroidota bacterium]|nr:helix-hairpin-helix domain-containing protein [Bacteroidota bacterium]